MLDHLHRDGEAGSHLSTPDAVLARAAANCAEAYRRFAEAVGKPWRIDEDMILADVGLPVGLPTNSATMLRPFSDDDAAFVADRLGGFFDESPGGEFQLWSMWPTPDLSRWGFHPWGVPCMIREAGGDHPPVPDELHIVEALDAAAVAQASSLLGDAFGVPPDAQPFMDPAFNAEDARILVGRRGRSPRFDGHGGRGRRVLRDLRGGHLARRPRSWVRGSVELGSDRLPPGSAGHAAGQRHGPPRIRTDGLRDRHHVSLLEPGASTRLI